MNREVTWKHVWEFFPIGFVLVVASLFVTLFVDPLRALFTKPTPRFRELATLRLDALCDQLLEGKDFEFEANDDRTRAASEEELQKIAHHISMQAAGLFTLEQYPQLSKIFRSNLFWLYLNGYAENERHKGIRMGFYLAVVIGVVIYSVI